MSQFDSLIDQVAAGLRGHSGALVAFSGGVDSTALLWLTSQAARRLSLPCRAIHVDHAIHPESLRWAQHCSDVAGELGVELNVCRVELIAGQGNLEARARSARYDVFRQQMQSGDLLLTGHHAGDQAETVLLRLLRGAGPKGLSAIPERRRFESGELFRPLLSTTQAQLRDICVANRLAWLEDPSNTDPAFDRNFLRHSVLPLLAERWPDYERGLGQAAQRCAEAQHLVTRQAAREIGSLRAGPRDAGLSLSGLMQLSREERASVLRYRAAELGLALPGMAQIEQFDAEVAAAAEDREPRVAFADAELRRYRDVVYLMARLPDAPAEELELPVEPGWQTLPPGCGEWRLGLDRIDAPLSLRFLRGGEKIRLPGHAHHAKVKTLCQTAAVPPWVRRRMPLLYAGDDLLAVADYWRSDHFADRLGEQVEVEWRNAPVAAPVDVSTSA